MQVDGLEARRLVNLLHSGAIISTVGRRRTAGAGHAAGRTTLLRVDLSHDRVGDAFEGLLLGFVLKSC